MKAYYKLDFQLPAGSYFIKLYLYALVVLTFIYTLLGVILIKSSNFLELEVFNHYNKVAYTIYFFKKDFNILYIIAFLISFSIFVSLFIYLKNTYAINKNSLVLSTGVFNPNIIEINKTSIKGFSKEQDLIDRKLGLATYYIQLKNYNRYKIGGVPLSKQKNMEDILNKFIEQK